MGSYSLSSFKIRLIYSILNDHLNQAMPLDVVYANYFKKLKLQPQEQALIIRLINDVLRRLNYYCHIAGYKKIKDIKRHINKLILVIHMVHKWPLPKDLPDTEDFNYRKANERKNEADAIDNLKYGCPLWLDTLAYKELKELWEPVKEQLSVEHKCYIRVNTLKINIDSLRNALSAENISTSLCPDAQDALEVTSNCSIFRTESFKQGFFEQQDKGSQQIARFLEVTPGMKVVDACAGFGGKTLHLSALMQGKGTIIAMDNKEYKLKGLKERAKRAGAFNVTTRLIDSTKVIKRLSKTQDRVLLDVPCSGLGVLKRNFDTKWVDRTLEIKELINIQRGILDRYSDMTKVGGKLVYSTCSILPSENSLQIKHFLAKHHDFILEDEKLILPDASTDGFYMARLVRVKEDEVPSTKNLTANEDSLEATDDSNDSDANNDDKI